MDSTINLFVGRYISRRSIVFDFVGVVCPAFDRFDLV